MGTRQRPGMRHVQPPRPRLADPRAHVVDEPRDGDFGIGRRGRGRAAAHLIQHVRAAVDLAADDTSGIAAAAGSSAPPASAGGAFEFHRRRPDGTERRGQFVRRPGAEREQRRQAFAAGGGGAGVVEFRLPLRQRLRHPAHEVRNEPGRGRERHPHAGKVQRERVFRRRRIHVVQRLVPEERERVERYRHPREQPPPSGVRASRRRA